ncbi:MAG: hypothetical protein AB1306_00125 [Nitrospirota bacterium]
MNRHGKLKSAIFCLTILCLILVPLGSIAKLDDLQLRLLKQYDLPLRWDNIEGPPQWVSGKKLSYNYDAGLHMAELKPGEFVTFRVPSGETARIYNPECEFSIDDIELAVSNGSGAYSFLPYQFSADLKSIIFSPLNREPSLVRVSRKPDKDEGIKIAFFISRHETQDEIAPYRRMISLPGKFARIHRSGRSVEKNFKLIKPHEPVSFSTKEAQRVAIESRIAYPSPESRRAQSYNIYLKIDDRPFQTLEFETKPEIATTFVNGFPEAVGREETAYIEIPEGEHTFEMETTAPLYIRLLKQESPDYLFAGANEPDVSAKEAREEGSPSMLRKSAWDINDEELQDAARAQEPLSKKSAALLWRDNSRREGGIAAVMLMDQKGIERPDHPEVKKEAEEIFLSHTFYRDLMPSNKLSREPQEFCWFMTPALNEPQQPDEALVLKQHLDDGLKTLSRSLFIPIPSGTESEPLIQRYSLPQRFAPSFLRVIVDAETTIDGQEIIVQLDDMQPVKMLITKEEGLTKSRYMANTAENALKIIKARDVLSLTDTTLSGAFSAREPVGRLIKAAFAEIPLPQDVKEVKLWSSNSLAGSVAALQYRSSRPYQLSETEFLDFLKKVNDPYNLLIKSLASVSEASLLHGPSASLHETLRSEGYAQHIYVVKKDEVLINILKRELRLPEDIIMKKYIGIFKEFNPEVKDIDRIYTGQKIILPLPLLEKEAISEIELSNHLLTLTRFLNYMEKTVIAGIAPPIKPEAKSSILSQTDIAGLITNAETAEKNGELVDALQLWTNIMHGSDGREKDRAQFARADILEKIGEEFLAENLLRGMLFFSQEEQTREEALIKLTDFYRKRSDSEGLLSLFAAAAIRQPDYKKFVALSELLTENSEYEMALALGLLLPEPEQPLQAMIKSAHKAGWWKVFETLVEKIKETEEGHYWRGLKLEKDGDYTNAIYHLRRAGAKGMERASAIEKAVSIRSDLTGNSSDLTEWERWQAQHPQPFIWEEAPYIVTDYAGAANLYNKERDMYSRAFISQKDRPVKLTLMGPVSIRIEARPLHTDKSAEPLDGWLEIRGQGSLKVLPISNNVPSQNLVISGSEGMTPGIKAVAEYNVGAGLHHIEVSGGDMPLLIQTYIKSPEIRIGVLPPITPDTLAALTNGKIVGESECPVNEADATPALIDNDPANEVLKQMITLLWIAEKRPEQRSHALAKAEELSLKHPYAHGTRPLLNRIFRGTTLMPYRNIQSSAGVRMIEEKGWDPFSPGLRIRKALLSPVSPDEHVLYGYDSEIIYMKNLQSKEIQVTATIEDVGYLPLLPMTGYFQLDSERVDNINLAEGRQKTVLLMKIPAGEHFLRIGIKEPVPNQFLRMHIAEVKKGKEISVWDRPVELQYYIATEEEPVVMEIEGPSVLQIEELSNGKIYEGYRKIEEGWQTVKIPARDGQKETLYRFYRRGVKDEPVTPVRKYIAESEPKPEPLISPASPKVSAYLKLKDDYPLGGQEDGTWTLSGEFVERRNLQEDSNFQDGLEEFIELKATYRSFDDLRRTLFRTDMLGRIREFGGPTLGLKGSLDWRPINSSLDFQFGGSLYLQYPDKFLSGQREWSVLLNAKAAKRIELGTKTFHVPSLAVFQRYLSMESYGSYIPEKVDQDIFTPYKFGHKRGLILTDTLNYRPWLDTNLYLGASVVSNEDMDIFNPDNISLRAGWRQLIGAFQVNAEYRRNHYLSDDDRNNSSDRERVELEVLWEKWSKSERRLELGLDLIHELDTGVNSGMIFLRWHMGNGRGLRDFNYGEIDFLDIRERRVPSERNNTIEDAEERY